MYVFLSPAVVVVTVAFTLYMRTKVKKGKNLDRSTGLLVKEELFKWKTFFGDLVSVQSNDIIDANICLITP